MYVSGTDALARHAGAALLPVTQLSDPDARSVVLGGGSERVDIIVVCAGGEYFGYLNSCPHKGTPLETFDGRILDAEDPDILVCSTHGARFRACDGICIAGPCFGGRLRPVNLAVDAEWVRLAA